MLSLHQAKTNPLCYFYICPRIKFWYDRGTTHPMQNSNWVFMHSPITSSRWQYMQFLLELPLSLHIIKHHINSYQCNISVIPCLEGFFLRLLVLSIYCRRSFCMEQVCCFNPIQWNSAGEVQDGGYNTRVLCHGVRPCQAALY